jgi:ABC-type glycerol-3-phosphate transport system permease component
VAPGHATELLITYIYKSGFGQTKFDYAAALTVVQFMLLARAHLSRQSPRRRQRWRLAAPLAKMSRRRTYLRHSVLIGICAAMLMTLLLGAQNGRHQREYLRLPAPPAAENPHLFNFVDVWYFIPSRYLMNSLIVSALVVAGNIAFNAMAGYALTKSFPAKRAVLLLFLSCMLIPFQATIIPAYLITSQLGLLNSYLGLALPCFRRLSAFSCSRLHSRPCRSP